MPAACTGSVETACKPAAGAAAAAIPPLHLQVPTMFMSGYLLFRALGLAAANLTVNEWMNRARYVHLHHTGAGFSNRFDRGVAANCYDFWCGPKFVDYWAAWDAAEQVSFFLLLCYVFFCVRLECTCSLACALCSLHADRAHSTDSAACILIAIRLECGLTAVLWRAVSCCVSCRRCSARA